MGSCFSKKHPSSSSSPTQDDPLNPSSCSIIQTEKNKKKIDAVGAQAASEKSLLEQKQLQPGNKEQVQQQHEKPVPRKDEFMIQQARKSADSPSEPKCPVDSDGSISRRPFCFPNPSSDGGSTKGGNLGTGTSLSGNDDAVLPRTTSSCTEEEVDAILIQCGRLSKNNSSGKGISVSYEDRTGGASCSKYAAGPKRRHDFDSENLEPEDGKRKLGVDPCLEEYHCDDDGDDGERRRRRESVRSSRRRTPSLGREKGKDGGGRRLSRSPGRRSESPILFNGASAGGGNGNSSRRPGKMASVPATVSSLSNDKGSMGDGCGGEAATSNGNVKRISVGGEGGVAGSRGSASPRSQAPAVRGGRRGAGKVANENNNQQPQSVQPFSRKSSRKAERSPHHRTPLNVVDTNSLQPHPLTRSPAAPSNSYAKPKQKTSTIGEEKAAAMVEQPTNYGTQKKWVGTSTVIMAASAQGKHTRTGSRGGEGNGNADMISCFVGTKLQDTEQLGKERGELWKTAGADTIRSLTRSRSSRRSQDIDMLDVEALLDPNTTSSYNSLLLQDIRNFHQSNNNPNSKPNAFSSNANPNTNTDTKIPLTLPPCLSKACSILQAVADLNSSTSSYGKESNFYFTESPTSNKWLPEEVDEPFVVETQVNTGDDLMEPSIHKYVTIRKKGTVGEEQESSGTNSLVTTSQLNNWAFSTSWEPNSADSTDCWKSQSTTRGED